MKPGTAAGITQVRSATVVGSFSVFQIQHSLWKQKVDDEATSGSSPHESPDVDKSDKWTRICNKCWTNAIALKIFSIETKTTNKSS